VTEALNLTIYGASTGGHALLGLNGAGKSLVSKVLTTKGHGDYLKSGSFRADPKTVIEHVSFESHESLLEKGGTAFRAIASHGKLSKAAQFLVIRFGIFPLLYRDVRTLSTGEIRKVMLIRALSSRPDLLVLDNAFDGLDVPSREALKDLVSKTLRGFRQDVLVQGINARTTAHTQVLLIAHRAEELVEEIGAVSRFEEGRVATERRGGRCAREVFAKTLGGGCAAQHWDDAGSPCVRDISRWWRARAEEETRDRSGVLVRARNLSVCRDEATLLRDIDWTVRKGERWLLAGKNGSGKSTLSRLLARREAGVVRGSIAVSDGVGVGWVSTERHMAEAKSHKTTYDILTRDGETPLETAVAVLGWLGVHLGIYHCKFSQLSQGEQKVVLIASAIASRPRVLVLDEPCQGLDFWNRRNVLALVETLCQGTDISLVYITHHFEEILPSISHVLHLHQGRDLFNGLRQSYDPKSIQQKENL